MAPAEHVRPEQITAEQIARALRTSWHRTPDGCAAIRSGMHSVTWQVEVGTQRFAAKLMPAARRAQLEAGLAVAERLGQAGLAAGRPVRAEDGALTVPIEGTVVALLAWVPGRPLDPADGLDQQWWGDTLGAVHSHLRGYPHAGLTRFHGIRPDAPHLAVEPWIAPAVAAAVAAVKKLSVTDQLTYGVLHGDPAPDAFRLDPATGRTGVIDWGSAATGPLSYDIGSAVTYAGGVDAAGDLIEAYLAAGPVGKEELDAALPTMQRFRWAVEADYFAQRIAAHQRAGEVVPAESAAGLRRARDGFAALDAAADRDADDD